MLGASKLSGLIDTMEVVSNETNRGVTGDSDDAISRGIWRMAEKQSYSDISGKAFRRLRKDFSQVHKPLRRKGVGRTF